MGGKKKFGCRHKGCSESFKHSASRWHHEKRVHGKSVKNPVQNGHVPVCPRFCYNCGAPVPARMFVEMPK